MAIYLSLGSNIEPRLHYIEQAKLALQTIGLIERESSLYETEPFGAQPQQWYINQVVSLATALPPQDLLVALKNIEQQLGRKTRPRWSEREIDIDILLYGDTVLDTPELTIPHTALAERRFVLLPLAEIATPVIEPTSGQTIQQLLGQCPDTLKVSLYHPA
jgi:2-amino-4-hydroxy-6-hydroxymethyldihydropteridine diphosphokinase